MSPLGKNDMQASVMLHGEGRRQVREGFTPESVREACTWPPKEGNYSEFFVLIVPVPVHNFPIDIDDDRVHALQQL